MISLRSRLLPAVVILLRVVLGLIFVYAGYIKLKDPWQLFAASIVSYDLVPLWMAEWTAKILPWLEVAGGAGLLVGWRFLPPASIGTALLLLVFNTLVWRAFLQGKEIDCGCFGPGEALTWKT